MRFDILTTFPEMFTPEAPGALGISIPARARAAGLVDWHATNIRDHSDNKHNKTDERPFGGGPGMVIKPEPVFACLEDLLGDEPWPPLITLSAHGERYNQRIAKELSAEKRIVLLCGHYEGFDQRILDGLPVREVSLGDYVLTGGELPALVIVDTVVRLLPGVLGDADSATYESFNDGLLDHPHYTRPVDFRGMTVPEILRSGDHSRIAQWRREQAERITRDRRPDLNPGDGDEPASS